MTEKPLHNQFNTESLSHLGILSGVLKKIRFVERIDKMLPITKEKGAKTTIGERSAAMVYNALGFIDSRLYMFSEFLDDKPIKRLMSTHLSAKHFTDDALGRCLDQIYEYGPTQFVSDITFQIALQLDLLGKTIHVDSTSLSVYGEYDQSSEKENQAPQVTYGFSKENRADLKQLILNLAVTNKADLPVFMAAHSGNASDQKILIQATKQASHLSSKIYNCEKDAGKSIIGYKIQGDIEDDQHKMESALAQKRYFILATNQLDVSSVFLKKPSRISALMAMMVLSLFTYSLTQYLLREALKENGEFVPNQLKKPIQRPTAKWIFFLFRNIQILHIQGSNEQSQELVVNLTPLLERIINYFGEETAYL